MCARKNKGEKGMDTTSEQIDVKYSLEEAMKEVKEIREGRKPKQPWRKMITRVRDNLEK